MSDIALMYIVIGLYKIGFLLTSIDICKFFYQKEKQLKQSEKKPAFLKALFALAICLPCIFLLLFLVAPFVNILKYEQLNLYLFSNCCFDLLLLLIIFWDCFLSFKDKSYKSAFKMFSKSDWVLAFLLCISLAECFFFIFKFEEFINLAGISLLGFFALFLRRFKKRFVFNPTSNFQKAVHFFTLVPRQFFYYSLWLMVFLGVLGIIIIPLLNEANTHGPQYRVGEKYYGCKDGEDCIVSQETCLKRGYIWYKEGNFCEGAIWVPVKGDK